MVRVYHWAQQTIDKGLLGLPPPNVLPAKLFSLTLTTTPHMSLYQCLSNIVRGRVPPLGGYALRCRSPTPGLPEYVRPPK